MESRIVKPGGVHSRKRKKSSKSNLKSFCESKFSKGEGNKRKVSGGNVNWDNAERNKIITEAPLSCCEPDSKKSRNKDNGNDTSKGLHGISLALGGNINLSNIPKRPRSSVGRRKLESQDCQRSSSSVHKDELSSSRLVAKLVGSTTKCMQKADSKSTLESHPSNLKLKRKVKSNVIKESNLVSNCLDTPNSGSSKEDFLVVGRDRVEAWIREPEPSVGSAVSNSLFTDDEDDEENLEQNAARMLSSRFDPSCTGFSSKINSSVSRMADDLPFFQVSSGSGDDIRRSLRPRRADKGKDLSKSRRHFYEVSGRDLDPYWVLKQRIKIFWPLDDSWYEGIVNDYHIRMKLHHIKYDDMDEEWVNLEEEKIKLLLLRCEVPEKANFRKRSTGVKDTHADDDISIDKSLDSESMALWMAGQSPQVKALLKSPKRQKSSHNHLSLVSSFSSEKTDISEDVLVDDLEITTNKLHCKASLANRSLTCGIVEKPLSVVICQNDKHLVYARKKNSKKSVGIGYFLQVWSYDDKGKSTLNDVFMGSKELRIQIYLPILPYLEFLCGIGCFRMVHDMFMLKHGVITTTSPAVLLELIFIDINFGLRLLLFEGCLKDVLTIVFQILIFFSQSDEQRISDPKLPMTSIRFQLSSVNDLWNHVVAVYHFSKLQSSKWLYLETKVLQHCLLIKQLSLSERTYGNVKELECGNLQPSISRVGLELSSNEYFKENFDLGIFTMSQPGKFLQLPTLFPNLHLQSFMEHSFAQANLQHQNATRSQGTSEKVGQPVVECGSPDIPTEHEVIHLDTDPPASRSLSVYERADVSILNSKHMGSKNSSKTPVFMPNGFGNGPQKPRTKVQYSLPFVDNDFTRDQNIPSLGSLPRKKIRRASLKRMSDDSGNNQKNLDSLTCSANVLVTNKEKGWRECGADVLLEAAAGNVKNIPIPGVRVVEVSHGYEDEVSFAWNSKMYFRQVQTDVEMAMDPTRVLYDMDSDDERWLTAHKYEEITDMFLVTTMDMFEKVSHARGRENFTDAEVEELAVGVGSVEAINLVYQHWRWKREKMCMPLIRHLQPPTWKRYQQQLKEWENSVSCGDGEKEKPPMFAFCLKPLGLDVPINGSKHRKFSVSNSTGRGNLIVYGRGRNEHNVWKNKKHKKKLKSNPYFLRNKKGSHLWKQQMDISSVQKALGVAKHAHETARLKKERARRLLYRADLAINRAVSTLMNAEAIKD